MATIAPFKGIHYRVNNLGGAEKLITPPYDVIPKEEVPGYLSQSPYNFIRLILPDTQPGGYDGVRDTLAKWKSQNIFEMDPYPSYFLYRQSFELLGKNYQRDTLICLVLLEEFSKGIVRPHENTFGKYKEDRLNLLRATHHNFRHIFGMVKDEEGVMENHFEKWQFEAPLLQAKMKDGVEHTLWRTEGAKSPQLPKFFEQNPIYIVDGHHRYESSLTYAKETGAYQKKDQPAAWMLFAISNCFDPGLVVLPTHRIVKNPPKNPDLLTLGSEYDLRPTDWKEILPFTQTEQKQVGFVLHYQGKDYFCAPKTSTREKKPIGKALNNLSVAWSDARLLADHFGIQDSNRRDHVFYERDASYAWEKQRDASAIIFHAPPAITDVTDVADAKEFMPQKSTYFFPKLWAGTVFRELV